MIAPHNCRHVEKHRLIGKTLIRTRKLPVGIRDNIRVSVIIQRFSIKKLTLLLVGASELPELFDAIKLQYQLVLNFFHLEDL